MTGHPALSTLLETAQPADNQLGPLREDIAEAWRLTHASEFSALTAVLVPLLGNLEHAARVRRGRPLCVNLR